LKDCTFNSQTREVDASSLSAGSGVADGDEDGEGIDEMLVACDLGDVGEGTV